MHKTWETNLYKNKNIIITFTGKQPLLVSLSVIFVEKCFPNFIHKNLDWNIIVFISQKASFSQTIVFALQLVFYYLTSDHKRKTQSLPNVQNAMGRRRNFENFHRIFFLTKLQIKTDFIFNSTSEVVSNEQWRNAILYLCWNS